MPDPTPPEPTPPDGPGAGRARLLQAIRHPSPRSQGIVAVLLALLGFASVVQVRAEGEDDNFTGARQQDLIALINSITLATDRAENEVAGLQRTRDNLRGDTASSQTALGVAREQAATLGILAGTVPVQGSGVRVTVEAGAGVLGTDQLLNGLEELRDAGAEAIEINDEVRVVAQTGIVDASNGGLIVDGRQLRAPYVIDAIGDPHTLATALDFDGGFVEEVTKLGGTVDINESRSVEIATTVDPPTPRFAQPDE